MTFNRDYQRVERAIQFLSQHVREQPRLEQVAAEIGLSEYHFQRLFRRWAGISPKRFLQYLTAEQACELLRSSRSVLDAAFDAGLSGTGRLHDLMIAMHAATPAEVKSRGAGLAIHYGIHPSPFGECLIAVTERGICALEFLSPLTRAQSIANLKASWTAANVRESPRMTRAIVERLYEPRSKRTPPPIYVAGTNFQIRVWEALLRIPPGCIAAYEDVARLLGVPRATRAVASAVARNPVALLIPCHRVIRKTGAFGDYRWGTARKQALLAWESARPRP